MESQVLEIFKDSNRVDYTTYSTGRTLAFFNHFVTANRLAKGNSKLYNILIFDLPAVVTCLNCSDCKDKCYAMKAQRMYTDTKIFRDTNLFLYKYKRDTLHKLIVNQLLASKETTVRIHGSGDFFEQSYIEFWSEIVKAFPNKRFYAYTKVKELLDFSVIESLSNFNLIDSFVANYQLNFGTLQYCELLHKNHNTFICPATKASETKVRCGLNCSHCITNKNVCFVIH